MEQLIIFLLLGVASLASTYLQNKKKREAEKQREQGRQTPAPRVPKEAVPWPKTSRDWHEELRRILQGEMAPPPVQPRPPVPAQQPPILPRVRIPTKAVPPPVRESSEGDLVLPTPLKQSESAYDRAGRLSERVAERLQAIDSQTKAHQPTQILRHKSTHASSVMRQLAHDRNSLRDAFIASLIFAPPVGLRSPTAENVQS